MKKALLLTLFSLFILNTTHVADSLFQQRSTPLYGIERRQISEGDIITIYISESTSAAQQASTRTEKESSLAGSLEAGWEQISNLLGNETVNQERLYRFGGEDQYEGSGQTSRRSNVRAVVSSIVTEISDTGNLYVEGIHHVKVNNEVETIRVAGLIRPQDISPSNSVYSYQIAKAEISVNGVGVVASKQTPGLMTKVFNWLF